MKKLCIALILVVMLSICPAAFAEEAAFISVEGTYPDGTTGFIYSDDMLLEDSSPMSGDLCKVSASLAAASYNEDSVIGMLSNIGYESYGFDYGERSIYDYDRVAYVIAKKQINNRLVYCIVIRGTSGYEWFSNFNMDDSDAHGGRHPGFSIAANKVMETLDSVLANDAADKDNTVLLFTGHSRGAAVANILAAHYTKNQEFATQNHIHAYTFACPAVTKHPEAFDNIFNFNITGDAVPAVPLAAWDYYRNGIDCPMGTGAGPAFSTRYLSEFGRNNASTPDTVAYEYLIKTLFPTEQSVNEPKGQFFAMLLAWKMAKQPISLNDFLIRFGYNVFSDNELFQEITSKTDLKSIYDLLSDDYAKYSYNDNAVLDYKEFLEDAIDKTENYTEQEFGQWMHDNAETLSDITDLTGQALEEYADLAAALSVVGTIIKYAPTAWDAGTVIGCILDICGNSTDGVNAVLDGHRTGTYVLKINADYYGYRGWENAQNVGEIVIPDNVKTIGYRCFAESDVITISGMEQVECLGNQAFSNTSLLDNVQLDSVVSIGQYCFQNSSVISVSSLKNVTYMGDHAFQGASRLESAELGSLKSIGKETFADCINLKDLDLSGVELIYPYAFQNCVSLESLYIPDTVKEIRIERKNTFFPSSGTSTGQIVYGPFEGCTGLRTISVGGVENLYFGGFRTGSTVLEELTIRGTVKTIGADVFSNKYKQLYDFETDHPLKLIIEDGVEVIGDFAFYGTSFTEISIPSTIKELGGLTFSECNGIKSMNDVSLNINWVGASMFANCDGLTSIDFDHDISFIGNGAFSGCDNITELVFSQSVDTIGNSAFMECKKLNSVDLSKVKNIGNGAFSGCTSLKSIDLSGVEKIGNGAFEKCTSLESLYIPDSVKEINVNTGYRGPFYNCTGVKSISIGGITVLDRGMLRTGSPALEKLTIRGTVKEINYNAFYSNNESDSQQYNFAVEHPVELIIEEGLETIRGSAFYGCSMFTSISIPSTVQRIETNAFYGCSSLQDVFYAGSQAAFELIDGSGNNLMRNVNLHFSCSGNGIALDETNFPDPAFRHYVSSSKFDTDRDGCLNELEIAAIKALDCGDKNIYDLTGIENFTCLETLYCYSNHLTKLNISNNTALLKLHCDSNELTILDISNNPHLTYLSCSYNLLTSLSINHNPALEFLHCVNNDITSLTVSSNPLLKDLGCSGNNITSLDLSANPVLEYLRCDDNDLSVIDLGVNHVIQSLYCQNNNLTRLDISLCTKLDELVHNNIPLNETDSPVVRYYKNSISLEYDALVVLTKSNLVYINERQFPDPAFRTYIFENCDTDNSGYLSDEEINAVTVINVSGEYEEPGTIASLKGIEYFTALKHLSCSSNQLTSLDISSNTALEFLDCYNNKLTELNVNNNASLESLYCQMNQLGDLDIQSCIALQYLSCNDNHLSSIDVGNNVALLSLYCHNNRLLNLDVSNNYALEVLGCWNNQLTSLDVGYNTALKDLECGSNLLSSLDISNNAALEVLDCQDNQLASLNISGITSLHSLSCNINQLTNLDLSNNINLLFLCCHSNQLTNLILSNNKALEHLDCGSNQLTILNLSNNTSLGWLDCPGNQLTSLDVSQCPRLVALTENMTPTINNIVSYGPDESGRFLRYDEGVTLTTVLLNDNGVEINVTNFPDSFFRFYISANYDIDKDGYLSDEEIAKVKEITVYGGNENQGQISSLTGIEFFTALEKLDCSSNQLSALDVSKNTALVELNCGANLLANLNTSQNSALQKLWCSNNQLTELDVSANTALKDLACVGNQLTELNLRNNVLLESLACGMSFSNYYVGNQLTSLDLSNNHELTTLWCDNNQLTILDISKNTKLTTLMCSRNKLSELNVSNNGELYWLYCWGNQLTELDVASNTKLALLSCAQNQLTELDISNNPELVELYCNNNQLSELDVSGCAGLQRLSCSNNQLTVLNIIGCTEITNLYCSWNQLNAIDISGCTGMQAFECGANSIGSLDLSKNAALTHLGCFENQLTELDLSNNTSLQEIWCYSNRLNQLNLAACPNLYFLSCWNNKLSTLNIRNNTALQRLFCYQNLLPSLDVSACPNLIQITTTVLPTTENGVDQYADQENGYYLWVDEGIALISSVDSLNPDFTLPAMLTTIESEAFTGGAFAYVKLPENAVSIGWHAFADCPNLTYVYIPALTTQIDDEAFGNMQGLTIIGKIGTAAETYAQNHNYNFIAVP